MTMILFHHQSVGHPKPHRSISNRSRGVAIVLVIIAVAAAAVIGSAYVASQFNAPQIVGNVNAGIEARCIADSGADLATAIMECKTIDWRLIQSNRVLVNKLAMGNGTVTIMVADPSGGNPDATCEYPVIVSRGESGSMKQMVGMQVYSPLPTDLRNGIDVDLGEFAVFGDASVSVDSSWIMGWPASPMDGVGLPVNVGTNATAARSFMLTSKDSAPDSVGYAMSTAADGTFNTPALTGPPFRRVNFSTNETVLLPKPPTPSLGGVLWASNKTPSITSDTSISATSDRRYNSITVDNKATLTVDLGGGTHMVAISGPLTIQGQSILKVTNGHLNLVVTGAFNVFNMSALALDTNASVTIWCGSTMSIDNSVIGLPASVVSDTRDARKGLTRYQDPRLCVIYRIASINSSDANLADTDNASAWTWTNSNVESWIINSNSCVCGRIYGRSLVNFTLDNRSAVYGNVVAETITMADQSAVYYDQALNGGFGYTNPSSPLYSAPLDLRDNVRVLLTDLNDSTLTAIRAAVTTPVGPVPFNPFAPTPRDKARVATRWWKRYGVEVQRDSSTPVETVIASGVK